MLASCTTLVAILRLLLVFDLQFLILLLLGVLSERLPTRDVLFVADFYARVISDFYLVQLYFVEGGLSEECENLLYVGAIFGRCLYEGYVPLLGKPEPLLECDFPPV